jgi:hypothetical protein
MFYLRHRPLLVSARVKSWEGNAVNVTSVSAFWATDEEMSERQKRTLLHLPVRDRHPSRLLRVHRRARVYPPVPREVEVRVTVSNPISAVHHLHPP